MKTIEGAGSRFPERRTVPRFRFAGTLELTDPVTKTHTSGRVTEIGERGCFAEVENPLVVQSVVQVRIHQGENEFKTWALIVYQRTGGIGLHFLDTPEDELRLLSSWLDDLKRQAINREAGSVEQSRPRKDQV